MRDLHWRCGIARGRCRTPLASFSAADFADQVDDVTSQNVVDVHALDPVSSCRCLFRVSWHRDVGDRSSEHRPKH